MAKKRSLLLQHLYDAPVIVSNSLIEFLPVLTFLIAFYATNFFSAVASALVATCVSLLVSYLIRKRFAWFPVVTATTMLLFGSATLYSGSEQFFMLQDTVSNALWAGVLLLGLSRQKLFLKYVFENLIAITDRGWIVITHRWIVFFSLYALLNEVIRHSLDPGSWVLFKIIGTVSIFFFGAYQLRVSHKHRIKKGSNHLGLRTAYIEDRKK